jgi:peptide-methionine (S)-S-oxide reductase
LKTESIVLGAGCFWCTEATYQLVDGVEKVVPGYAGGKTDNPDYWGIHSRHSTHAEVVQVTFDTDKITLADILDIFWVIHDPTTPDRQGADVGREYRSIILFNNDKQKAIIDQSIAAAQKVWDDKIVTEVKPLMKFYEAEEEHHNFYKKHPELAYCQVVINPKLEKLKAKFAERLKK